MNWERRSRSPLLVMSIDATFRHDPFDSVSTGILKVETPLLKIIIEPLKGAKDDMFSLRSKPIIMQGSSRSGAPLTISVTGPRPQPIADREFRLRFNTEGNPVAGGGRDQLDDDRNTSERPYLYFMPLLTYNNIDRRYGDEEPFVDELIGLMLEPTGMERG